MSDARQAAAVSFFFLFCSWLLPAELARPRGSLISSDLPRLSGLTRYLLVWSTKALGCGGIYCCVTPFQVMARAQPSGLQAYCLSGMLCTSYRPVT
ncbi:hypothetical protein F4802DRAFT_497214 [Xylaria palmicola]|nr:hypothetical protein F4802DRAFT_497214 [Xylaria palmicola]